jgi:hypothetical protein
MTARTIRAMRTTALIGSFLSASALPAAASRYCDVCKGMPWWAEPVLVVTGFLIAIAILAGFVRLSERRRR